MQLQTGGPPGSAKKSCCHQQGCIVGICRDRLALLAALCPSHVTAHTMGTTTSVWNHLQHFYSCLVRAHLGRPAALPTATGWGEELLDRAASVLLPQPGRREELLLALDRAAGVLLPPRHRLLDRATSAARALATLHRPHGAAPSR